MTDQNIEQQIEKLKVHTYQITKLGRIKNEQHGYLCGESVDQLLALISKQVSEARTGELERLKVQGRNV